MIQELLSDVKKIKKESYDFGQSQGYRDAMFAVITYLKGGILTGNLEGEFQEFMDIMEDKFEYSGTVRCVENETR